MSAKTHSNLAIGANEETTAVTHTRVNFVGAIHENLHAMCAASKMWFLLNVRTVNVPFAWTRARVNVLRMGAI